MAIQSAFITFSLPEDMDSDQLLIKASGTKDGTYVTVAVVDYQYGLTRFEYDQLDDTIWYRIQFNNSKDNEIGPISDPAYGGTFSAAAPFLAVSSTSDGAHYATSTDVYEYSGLNSQDVPQSKVSASLKRARAVIDFRTAEMDFDRFDVFSSEVARRKYNATLRILKEAEINIALGNLYQNMADDIIIENRRNSETEASGSLSIGGTTIGSDSLAERSENILFLATLSTRYFATGEQLLSSLDANSIRLSAYDTPVRFPKFVYPGMIPRSNY